MGLNVPMVWPHLTYWHFPQKGKKNTSTCVCAYTRIKLSCQHVYVVFQLYVIFLSLHLLIVAENYDYINLPWL